MTIVDAVRACMADPRLAMRRRLFDFDVVVRPVDIELYGEIQKTFVGIGNSCRGTMTVDDILADWETFKWETEHAAP